MLQCLYVFVNCNFFFLQGIRLILWDKDQLNVFMCTQFKTMGAKVVFVTTILLEGHIVPCNFAFTFPFAEETYAAAWGNRALTWLTKMHWVMLSMQMFSLCYKKELDREMSFPSQMQSSGWHPEYTHGWLERGRNCMAPCRVSLLTFCHK